MTLDFNTCLDPPRVHFSVVGPWLFVIRPLGTTRFSAWTQRIGWERGEEKYFKELRAAKAWLQDEFELLSGQIRRDQVTQLA